MKRTLRQPCKECPFRRASTPGWLGSGNPSYFVSAALADEFGGEHHDGSYAEPCHMTVDYSDEEWRSRSAEQEVCVGALIFYRNVDPYKHPRERRRTKLIAGVEPDHDLVFSTVDEFVAHHESERSMRSWEFG